ncbi:MAG TPA: hypothetical protein VGP07_08650 [Polyangia bacterium]
MRTFVACRSWSAMTALAATAMAPGACGMGQQIAAGPVLGYVEGRGWSPGWEAGGGPVQTRKSGGDPVTDASSLFAHVSLGMSSRPGAPGREAREQILYAAWEPWFLVGGTLGVVRSSERGIDKMVGAWEAVPWVIGAPVRGNPLHRCNPCFTISLALGWRWSGGREFYLAPKVGILDDVAMPWPFQTYAD